jgi:hypothetical protein
VSLPYSLLHPGVFISRGDAVNREFALSSDGAATEITVGTVFRPENHRRPIRSNPNHSIRIQRLRLDDTGSVGRFAKESLRFLNM